MNAIPRKLRSVCLLACALFLSASPASAYIGPGAGFAAAFAPFGMGREKLPPRRGGSRARDGADAGAASAPKLLRTKDL